MSNRTKYLHIPEGLQLENSARLSELTIAYHTYGTFSPQAKVIWIAHALTGNADAEEWWPGLVGSDYLLNKESYFIVCANILGSCYGTTGAASINPETGVPYGKNFPAVTVRDMVQAHELLRKHLGIDRIFLGIGGSMGGQQMLEWAVLQSDLFEKLCVLATNAQHSAWGIAFNEAQRLAIEGSLATSADGADGLVAARAIAMLSYRHYEAYQSTQSEHTDDKLDDFRASSYQRYQGQKLEQRFDVHAYGTLSKAMDSHNLGRGRGGVEAALQRITAETLVIGIKTDLLFPPVEQQFLAHYIPDAHLEIIESAYGHDGFLVETAAITRCLQPFLRGKAWRAPQNGRVSSAVLRALPGSEGF